jgi:integrase
MGVTDPAMLTREQIVLWRDSLLQRASVSTWNTYRLQLKTMFNLGVKLGWLAENPFREVKPIQTAKNKKTVVKEVLIAALNLLYSEDTPIRPGWFWALVLKLLFFSGMRRRQLTTLRWQHIDFQRGTILLTMEGSKTKRAWEIPIPPNCVKDLWSLRERTAALCPDLEEQQVFRVQLFNSSYAGKELRPEQVTGAFQNLSKRLGCKVMPHRLRHTMATELAQGHNPDLRSLQYMLGHANLSTTLEYVNPELEQIRLQISKLSLDDLGSVDVLLGSDQGGNNT